MAKPLLTQYEIAERRRTALAYKSIESSGNRRSPQTRTSHEAYILDATKREKASATARDDRRNFTILAWMVRRHLDCVSRFTPYLRTGDDAVDRIINWLMVWHGRRNNFDALGRHSRDESLRMFEACKVLSGDAGFLHTVGGRFQGIEGDRLSLPLSGDSVKAAKALEGFSKDGVKYDAAGRRVAWCLCRRAGTSGESLEFERVIPASDLNFDGYWPERFDSTRGVSPLLTALNEAADVKETMEWLVLKAKASALFGLQFTRTGPVGITHPFGNNTEGTQAEQEASDYGKQLSAQLRAKGIMNFDLDPGDKIEEIESKTPNATVVDFTRELIRVILLALDIPFTFYDSLTASFSARIADRNEYEEACEWKRDKNIDLLHEMYGDWLFQVWYDADLFGLRKAMRAANMDVATLASELQWMPAGRPWLDRTGEMAGHILALSAGVESIPEICASYGKNAYQIARDQKEYLDKCGIPILYAQGGQVPVNAILENAVTGGANGKGNGKGDGNASPKG